MSEYTLMVSNEFSKQWDQAIADMLWFEKNPKLGPEQKWHRLYGFYHILEDFRAAKKGDIIFVNSTWHSRVVKLATPTTKQEFYNYSPDFCAYGDMKLTPYEYLTYVKELTPKEVYKLLPHMSPLIRNYSGYRAYVKDFPEWMCTDCISELKLELKKGHAIGPRRQFCQRCGKPHRVLTSKDSLKPIGR